ncbi:hypothetical protein [Parahalioglobus pacificus]|nr:hypothetical protein [Halioglobus pacificus]
MTKASVLRVLIYAGLLSLVVLAVSGQLSLPWGQTSVTSTPSPFAGPAHELPRLSDTQRQQLLALARASLLDAMTGTGQSDAAIQPVLADAEHRVYVVAWHQRQRIASAWAHGKSLTQNVLSAAEKAARLADTTQLSRAATADELDIHLHVMGRDRPMTGGGYIHGLHGLSVMAEATANYYGAYAVEANLSEEKLLQVIDGSLISAGSTESAISRYYYRVDHFSGAGSEVVKYAMGNTFSADAVVNHDDYRALGNRAQQWLLASQKPSGDFRYLYLPARDRWPASRDNVLRQLMASRTLAELASEQPALLAAHRDNLNYMFTHWYWESNGEGYIVFRDKSKLGAMAMALRTLVYSPFYEEYAEQARALVNGILSLDAGRQGFRAWYIEPDYAFDEQRLLTFYSGEALLALAEYAQRADDAPVLARTVALQDVYLQRYVDDLEENYYPAYVPWHVQSLRALYALTGDERYPAAVFTLTDKLLELLDSGASHPQYRGRFYNPETPQYGSPHASSDAVYMEGVAHALHTAHQQGDDLRVSLYSDALRMALSNLDNLQYRGERMYFVPCRDCVEGALRVSVANNRVRVDSTQHAVDAFLKIDALLNDGVFSLQ